MEWMYEWVQKAGIRQVVYLITMIADGVCKFGDAEIKHLDIEQYKALSKDSNAYIRTAIIHDVERVRGDN